MAIQSKVVNGVVDGWIRRNARSMFGLPPANHPVFHDAWARLADGEGYEPDFREQNIAPGVKRVPLDPDNALMAAEMRRSRSA